MNNLPGNPFEEVHERIHHQVGDCTVSVMGETDATLIWSAIENHGQAALALAFEQRTANLIAYMQLGVLAHERGITFEDDVADEIMWRLGIEETE